MINNKEIIETINKSLEKKEEFMPFLFTWTSLTKVNFLVHNLISELFEQLNVDKNNLFLLEDTWEKLKIDEIKNFVNKSHKKPSWLFQVFFIENISRFTLQAANSTLKFLEEPGVGNIIFLTNGWENYVLDTILSRVNVHNINFWLSNHWSDFYYSLIDNYIKNDNIEILSYFFSEKLEKENYINFLKTLIEYGKKNFVFLDKLDEIENSINMITNNNIVSKYQVDKFLMQLWVMNNK